MERAFAEEGLYGGVIIGGEWPKHHKHKRKLDPDRVRRWYFQPSSQSWSGSDGRRWGWAIGYFIFLWGKQVIKLNLVWYATECCWIRKRSCSSEHLVLKLKHQQHQADPWAGAIV